MTDTKKLIDSIRKVYDEKGLTIGKVEKMFIDAGKGGAVGHTTIGRFFSKEKRSDYNYHYEDTVRQLAELLLDVNTIEDSDDAETQAMKSFVQFKKNRIDELEAALAKEKKKRQDTIEKYEQEIVKIREQHDKDTEMLRKQIAFKDKRMDQFIESMFNKDEKLDKKDKRIDELTEQIKELTQKLINCDNCRKAKK